MNKGKSLYIPFEEGVHTYYSHFQ